MLKERRNRSDPHPQGNFLLDKLLGAEVITIGPDEAVSQQQVMTDLAERLRSEGHRPYLSLQDLHLWAVGYVDCFLEIQGQLAAMGVPAGYIYLTSGLMSQAGLVLAARATGSSMRILGICPSHHQPDSRERIASLATEAGHFLGLDISFSAGDVDNTDAYVGDPEVRKFLEQSNPWALRAMAERLLEAKERGLWNASDAALATLREAVLEAEGWEESR